MSSKKAEEAKAADNEKRKRDLDNMAMVKAAEKDHNDIMADMTRQYKATQEELMLQDSLLSTRVRENDEEILKLQAKKESLI